MDASVDKSSHFNDRISRSLSRIGARRERYYSRKMTGHACTLLMRKVGKFYAQFFHQDVEGFGLLNELFPSLESLETNFLAVSEVYNEVCDGFAMEFGNLFQLKECQMRKKLKNSLLFLANSSYD